METTATTVDDIEVFESYEAAARHWYDQYLHQEAAAAGWKKTAVAALAEGLIYKARAERAEDACQYLVGYMSTLDELNSHGPIVVAVPTGIRLAAEKAREALTALQG